MKKLFLLAALCGILSCNNDTTKEEPKETSEKKSSSSLKKGKQHWEGIFTNGMKETYISFDISADGKKLENLIFKGYWRCGGQLEQTTIGPEGGFEVNNHKVDGAITEPEGGGATAMRCELKASFDGDNAEGTFRMNINALACDTYLLNWKAERKD